MISVLFKVETSAITSLEAFLVVINVMYSGT